MRFDEQLVAHRWLARSVVARHGVPARLVDDVTQDALLRAWRRRGSYEAGRAAFSTWLTLVCRTEALRYSAPNRPGLRAVPSTPTYLGDEAPELSLGASETPSPEALAALAEDVAAVKTRLTPKQRAALAGLLEGREMGREERTHVWAVRDAFVREWSVAA